MNQPQSKGPPTWLGILAVIVYSGLSLFWYVIWGLMLAVVPVFVLLALEQSSMWATIPIGVAVAWIWAIEVFADVFEYLWPSEQQMACRIDYLTARVVPAMAV